VLFRSILRASRFAKFSLAGIYDCEKINKFQTEEQIIRDDFFHDMEESEFSLWEMKFKEWTINNCLNEIIESFIVFLEFSYIYLDLLGKTEQLDGSLSTTKVLRKRQNEIRKKLRNKNILKALKEKNINFSEEETQIIESFKHIRDLLSHNLGISDERRGLELKNEKICLKWWKIHVILRLGSGKEVEVTSMPLAEEAEVILKQQQIHEKQLDLHRPILFSMSELQQIAWTFYLIVRNTAVKVQNRSPLKRSAALLCQ